MKVDLQILSDYFEQIARTHFALQHSPTKKAFFGIAEELPSSIRSTAALRRLEVDHYGGRYSGSPEMLDKPVNFVVKILVKAEANEASKQAAYNEAESIMDDIVAKLAYDATSNCALEGVNFNSLTFDKIGPEGQNEFGYRITIPFRSYAPSYNPQKWTA